MDTLIPQLSQMLFYVIQLIEAYGVAASVMVGVAAYIVRQRRDARRDLRYVLFLLLQVRISLNQYLSLMTDAAPDQVDSVMFALKRRGIDVDQQQVQDMKEQADQFVGDLSDRLYALDMGSFSESIREATSELSRTKPILAHQIVFLAKLPETLKSVTSFAESQRASLRKYTDPEVSPEVSEKTRLACEELLSIQVESQIRELVAEVDEQLLSLARQSGLLHWLKVWQILRKWRSPLRSSDVEVEAFTEGQLKAIMSSMKKNEQA